ncbi:plasminogen activator, urokinase b isoform X1 [Syngnathoides biaculeatus]|uniref:plasminogen activator, urokinase b isoform X1 n=1 Tax=Syngnathoides biaculeatus TaxID=300417 RepID=UPI002ADDDF8A|nr:plasminogen activator, urokinase b isoform X1 [Syngnathoides biaculeatus]XP_061666885.1 plasminogen activator, urokinase b isoform X1 [Syngnathoides biaculeatus]
MRTVVASLLLAWAFGPSSANGASARRPDEGRTRRQTILSSSWSSGICQNGGTSVPSVTTGRHMFCLCGDAFEGAFCETAKDVTDCYEGVGIYYRGFRSESESGRPCRRWDADTRRRYLTLDVDAGAHNYCRNVRFRRRPWCHVWKEQQLLWEYCDIPRCRTPQPFVMVPTAETPRTTRAAPPVTLAAPHGGQPRKLLPLLRVCVSLRVHVSPLCPPPLPASVGDVRPAFSQEADANRRRDGFGGGVAPVGGGHLLARQVQREGLPLRREFDRQLLGPDRRSLLPRRVRRTHPTSRHVAPRRLFLSGRSDAKERRFLVALGKSALNRSDALEQTFRVDRIVVRPDFNNEDGNYDNDVALMKLKPKEDGRCARESRAVRAACLPAPGRELPGPGSTCEIAGFGKEKHGLWYHSQFLLRASVDLLADDVCRRDDYYGDKISGNMLCAGRPDWSRDACEGDSGGPLVCPVGGRMLLLGVISWGEGCARDRRPGVYAKVLNYRAWIREHARV